MKKITTWEADFTDGTSAKFKGSKLEAKKKAIAWAAKNNKAIKDTPMRPIVYQQKPRFMKWHVASVQYLYGRSH